MFIDYSFFQFNRITNLQVICYGLQMFEDGTVDDWGCVGPDELFISSGPTPSLLSLAARVECRDRLLNISKLGIESGQQITEGKTTEEQIIKAEWEGTVDRNEEMNGQKALERTKVAKQGSKNLKQLAFEVGRFVAANLTDQEERQTAEQRMVIALGARPPRRKAINYRTLKEQRTEVKRKTAEEVGQGQQEKSIWKEVREGKVRKKKEAGRKRKNGSGVLKKREREERKGEEGGRKRNRK